MVNEIQINGGVHKYCESHQIYFDGYFPTDICPMCVMESELEETKTELLETQSLANARMEHIEELTAGIEAIQTICGDLE